MKIGEKLAILRNQKEISQTTMSQALEISQSYLSAIENGNRKCTMPILIKACESFKMSLLDFFLLEESYEDVDLDMVIASDLEEIGIEYIALAKEFKDKKIPLSEVKKFIDAFYQSHKI